MEEELPVVRRRPCGDGGYLHVIDNATKYAPADTLIVINAHRVHDEMVEIAVEDEGPGIPLHLRGKVFDRFFRADSGSDGRNAIGFGMGLAIARGIVEAHGGNICIEAGTKGRGTRVAFTVPVGNDDQLPGENGESRLLATANISRTVDLKGNGE